MCENTCKACPVSEELAVMRKKMERWERNWAMAEGAFKNACEYHTEIGVAITQIFREMFQE